MQTRRLLAAGLIAVATLTGCKFTSKPDLTHPGRADVQEKRAIRYDPYATPNVGPDVSDARPREYENPPSGPMQSRWHTPADAAANAQRWHTTGQE